ncbi:MAG: hypothetical protein K940chlam6_00910 [Chlamydiae bacterium]|nr:hypothetical protein [Chlamydiota bacterium]
MSSNSNSPLLGTDRPSINSQLYEAETVRRDLKIGLGVGVFGVLVSIATGVVLKVFHIGSEDAPFWIWGFGGGGFTLFTLKEGYNIHQERVRIQKQKTGMDDRVKAVWNIVISGMQNLVPGPKLQKATPTETFQALLETIQAKIQEPKPSDDTQLNQLQRQLKRQTDELTKAKRQYEELQGQLSEREVTPQTSQENENKILELNSQLNKARKDLEEMQQKHPENLQKATEEIQSMLNAKNQELRNAEKKLKRLDTQLQEALSTSQAQEEQSKKQGKQLKAQLKAEKAKYAEAVNWTQQLSLIITKASKIVETRGKSSDEPLPEIKLTIKTHPLAPLIKATNQLTKCVNDLYFIFGSENSAQSPPLSPNITFEESSTENSPSDTPNNTPSITPTITPSVTPSITPRTTPASSPRRLVKTKRVVTFDSPGTDAMGKALEGIK